MAGVRLILALHNHQPVGNFDGVFASSYRDGYLPFLEVMEDYPAIPFVLHTSGPLLEWLVEHQPAYVRRVRALVEAGRVEILGGGYFEPILTMIPPRDRVGQIRDYSRFLGETFGTEIRGIWLAERVWEQQLVASLVEAGVEYTVLDDFHFQRAGVDESDLRGYYLTEEDGKLLKVFPISERLRYQIPFQEPHAIYEYLRQVAAARPDSTVVFADDGEKFGSWPETHDHVYRDGWLRRFCDMIVGNREWLQPTTFARAVDATLPMGKIYLPDSSYREMTEWVLPPRKLAEFQAAVEPLGKRLDGSHPSGDPQLDRLRPFVRAGGNWRNFKAQLCRDRRDVRPDARRLEPPRRLDPLSPGRPRLPRIRADGPVPGPVQLPLLARGLRRPLPAPPPERDLPPPDRRRHGPRRGRRAGRPAGRDGGRRLQPRRPPGGPDRERPPGRLPPPGAGGPPLRTRLATRPGQSARHPRPSPRGLPRRRSPTPPGPARPPGTRRPASSTAWS